MPRKVILDVDPGIDDAVALAMALFDPRLEVVAVTAVAGNVSADQATRNVQAIIEQLDPPRLPRIGAAIQPDFELPTKSPEIYGADGLGNADFPVAELHSPRTSDKVIADEIRAAPEELTIIALGPLTNIATAFRRDTMLASQLGQLIIMGGTFMGPGNVTPVAEFNIYCDPLAARDVFRSASTKTIIPLDVTSQVVLSYNHMDQLPDIDTKQGRFLRKILPVAFRACRQIQGLEGAHIHDAVALLAATNPELFHTERFPGDVETTGELTRGLTIFDRRRTSQGRNPMDVATEVDANGAIDAILRALNRA